MDDGEFDFTAIDALQNHRKKGCCSTNLVCYRQRPFSSGILEKLSLDVKPLPKEEDVVERAKSI